MVYLYGGFNSQWAGSGFDGQNEVMKLNPATWSWSRVPSDVTLVRPQHTPPAHCTAAATAWLLSDAC